MSIKYLFLLLTVAISNNAFANESVEVKHFKDLKKVSLKCYIELVGGKTMIIQHYDLPIRDRSTFESELLKNGISQGRKTLNIYKVRECAESDEKFKDLIAERLYEEFKLNG